MLRRVRRAVVCAAALGACSAGPASIAPTQTPDLHVAAPALPCDPCREPPTLEWNDAFVSVRSSCAPTVELYRRTVPGTSSELLMICDVPCVDTSVAPGAIYAYAVAAPGTGVRSAEAYVDISGAPN